MDARNVRARLKAEGIDFEALHDGTFVASVTKPREESWEGALRRRVETLPGAVVTFSRELPSPFPSQARTVVRFVLGSAGMVGRAGREGTW